MSWWSILTWYLAFDAVCFVLVMALFWYESRDWK